MRQIIYKYPYESEGETKEKASKHGLQSRSCCVPSVLPFFTLVHLNLHCNYIGL